MKIAFDQNKDRPIYEQIIIAIKNEIISGNIKSHEPLPSIRGLAKDLQISVITTKRAYEELEQEGLIYSKAGKGFFVADQNVDLLREKKISLIENKLEELLEECREAGLSLTDVHDILDEIGGE